MLKLFPALIYFEVRNPEGQAAESETHTGEVIGNDATSIINDTPLESPSGKVTYADCQIEKVIYRDMVVVDHSLKDIVMDGASKSSSRKLKDDVQYQNENSVCEDIIDAGNETHIGVDDDGANANSDEERNLAGEKPRKFRLLSDIYKPLRGPCDAVSAGYSDSDFSSESEEDDSDEFTLDTSVRKKKGARVNSKTGVASKNRKRSQRRLTEENRSRATHGVNSVQLVQPTIATLNSIETASGCVEKSIRENSPPADDESMAALLLLSLFNSGVTTHTSSKATAKDAAVSVSNGEISSGIDEKVLPASGSIMDQSREEFNIINGAGLPQAEQVESGTSVCVMNMNPSEFRILNAKKYMRRVKVIRK
uniref:Uncharacterized protein n=1 Tax=Lactuca sativa TaxID=4236 RepID=A0A9R1XCY7_LACSA|nr:hypothetical protein LSAT_V11C400197600 [Lactuca sativa]